jgi:hypothetical protein
MPDDPQPSPELDAATQRIVDGSSWNQFCDTLKLAGNVITSSRQPDDPLTRTEGFRYLARLTRTALEAFLEHSDPLAPSLHRPVHETVKIGADNPDNYYQFATISGAQRYRLRGPRGTIHYLGLGTYKGGYGSATGPSGESGYLEGRDLQLGDDGSLEVILACERPEGAQNWLPMTPETSSLIVRQTYLDRTSETVAELTLQRLDDDDAPAADGPTPLTAARLDEGLGSSGRLVMGVAAMFANWVGGFQKHENELPEFNPEVSLAAHGDPNICYYHSYWRLAPDEALLVEVKPPQVCDYWNFQLNNHWMESLDYRFHTISINQHQARYADDGSVRLVVAHEDPGLDNWLDTAGHDFGTMCFRWIRADAHPQPQARVVKLAELAELAELTSPT